MKKVLSVFLAALMIFSFMAVTASAEEYTGFNGTDGADKNTQCVFKFRLNGGTPKNSQYVYSTETGKVTLMDADEIKGTFYWVPTDAGMYTIGSKVTLPDVVAPKGQTFQGWERKASNATYTENGKTITDNDNTVYSVAGRYEVKGYDIGSVVEFTAVFGPAEMEKDTFAKVFEILIKIFGTLIGLIAYQGNVEKGQEFMSKIFDSLG